MSKGYFTQKSKVSHYLLTVMMTEDQVYFVRWQNTAGVSQEKSMEVNDDQFSNSKKKQLEKNIKDLHSTCLA